MQVSFSFIFDDIIVPMLKEKEKTNLNPNPNMYITRVI